MVGTATLQDALLETAVPGLAVAPSTLDLLGVELEIATSKDRVHRLSNAIDVLGREVQPKGFTYVLIDCPPSLGMLTLLRNPRSFSRIVD